MGLNWSEGLRRAAAGLGDIAQTNQRNYELLYRQAHDANLMRFRKEQFQYQKNRDIETDERWRKQFEETVRARKATESAAEATREATEAYREGQAEHQRSVLAETQRYHRAMEKRWEQQAEDTANKALVTEKRYAAQQYSDRIDEAFANLTELESNMAYGPDSDEYKSALARYDSLRDQQLHAVNKVGLKEEELRLYMRLEGRGINPEVIQNYMRLTPEEQSSIDTEVKENLELGKQKGLSESDLYGMSIDRAIQAPAPASAPAPAPAQAPAPASAPAPAPATPPSSGGSPPQEDFVPAPSREEYLSAVGGEDKAQRIAEQRELAKSASKKQAAVEQIARKLATDKGLNPDRINRYVWKELLAQAEQMYVDRNKGPFYAGGTSAVGDTSQANMSR